MNKNINLCEILRDCPKGTKFYSTIHGEVAFDKINQKCEYPLAFVTSDNRDCYTTADGRHYKSYYGECVLFPSKDQRDWSKFTAPWLKKEKFDPKTLQPFDKVLVRIFKTAKWRCEHFSYFTEGYDQPYMASTAYPYCVPYNDDTKHLVGTAEEAPEYYRYWEN